MALFSSESGSVCHRGIVKILLVEDDSTTADALSRGLEQEGFTVEIAANGDEGLWLARESSPDLIVLDIMVPGKNGYQVCGELRSEGDWTPILMLTAKTGDLDEAEALDTGADGYLTKPFSFPVLVAHIRALLRRVTSDAPPPVRVGDLELDPRARKVWRGDTEVSLTHRQFDVLEFLVRRAGEVVTKEEIIQGVWRHDYDGDPNIVEVYVGRIRRAVDRPFGRASIETVRGAGYRLVDDRP